MFLYTVNSLDLYIDSMLQADFGAAINLTQKLARKIFKLGANIHREAQILIYTTKFYIDKSGTDRKISSTQLKIIKIQLARQRRPCAHAVTPLLFRLI